MHKADGSITRALAPPGPVPQGEQSSVVREVAHVTQTATAPPQEAPATNAPPQVLTQEALQRRRPPAALTTIVQQQQALQAATLHLRTQQQQHTLLSELLMQQQQQQHALLSVLQQTVHHINCTTTTACAGRCTELLLSLSMQFPPLQSQWTLQVGETCHLMHALFGSWEDQETDRCAI